MQGLQVRGRGTEVQREIREELGGDSIDATCSDWSSDAGVHSVTHAMADGIRHDSSMVHGILP